MTFKSRTNQYLIENAASSRARCRRCKQPIPNGALRLRIVAFVCPGRSTAFFRCCLDAKLAAAVLAVYGSAARVPCASQVDAGRAVQMRAALQLAAGEPPEEPLLERARRRAGGPQLTTTHPPPAGGGEAAHLSPQTLDLRPQTSDSDLRPQTSDLRPQTLDLRP
jgi:hypothetical protein